MKVKAIIPLIFLLVIAVSFVTQKSSARQSAKIKDTTGIAPSVSLRPLQERNAEGKTKMAM
jgi:hypothetical protein